MTLLKYTAFLSLSECFRPYTLDLINRYNKFKSNCYLFTPKRIVMKFGVDINNIPLTDIGYLKSACEAAGTS